MITKSNEPRKKSITLKTLFLLIAVITATFYVFMTITPALAKEGFFIGIGVKGVDHKTLTISKGDFVDWQNHDPSGSPPVTVTSDSGAFSSGEIKPGEIFDHTFNTQGTYKYFDKHHPSNKGEIIVT